MKNRRQFTTTLALMSTAGLLPGLARAQSADTVRILVGFPAGGGSDNIARRLAERLQGTLAPTVIVENRAGAGGQIAVSALKNSAPDGNTLMLSVPGPLTVAQFTFKSLPYKPDDYVPVAMVSTFAFVFAVGPAVPESVRNLKDYLAWASSNKANAVFGSPAAGATPHLVGMLLSKAAGVELTHVPYRGDAPGIQDLLGGQVPAYLSTTGSFSPHMKSGRLRLLAVSGVSRNPIAPDVPTFREQGYPIDLIEWTGIFAPKGTPPAVVNRLQAEVKKALDDAGLRERFAQQGAQPGGMPPADFARFIQQETVTWGAVAKIAGVKPE